MTLSPGWRQRIVYACHQAAATAPPQGRGREAPGPRPRGPAAQPDGFPAPRTKPGVTSLHPPLSVCPMRKFFTKIIPEKIDLSYASPGALLGTDHDLSHKALLSCPRRRPPPFQIQVPPRVSESRRNFQVGKGLWGQTGSTNAPGALAGAILRNECLRVRGLVGLP